MYGIPCGLLCWMMLSLPIKINKKFENSEKNSTIPKIKSSENFENSKIIKIKKILILKILKILKIKKILKFSKY